jgi:ABC-type nitrate/sulfonate/bicarbonate transport system ATPase subunit
MVCVRFSCTEDRAVLADFDLDVAAGETVCLFGPSGAGKSRSAGRAPLGQAG